MRADRQATRPTDTLVTELPTPPGREVYLTMADPGRLLASGTSLRLPSSWYTSISANADGPRDAASRKSNISRRTPSAITGQHTSIDDESTLLHRPRQLSVLSTYVHGEAQTLLGRFDVDVCVQVCNKFTTNRTDGAWASVYSSTGVVRRRCKKRRSAVDDIVDLTKRRAAAKVFKVHSCACKSKSREPNHATFEGDD